MEVFQKKKTAKSEQKFVGKSGGKCARQLANCFVYNITTNKDYKIMIIFTDRRSRTKHPLKRVTGGPLRSGATK